jgi:hypothetical protein
MALRWTCAVLGHAAMLGVSSQPKPVSRDESILANDGDGSIKIEIGGFEISRYFRAAFV